MNISQIDKDFINIIDYLDKKGFKPYSSCDGVLANHIDTKSVTSALSNVLEENEDSDLSFSLSLNSEYQPYMNKEGRVNVLRVSTKEGAGYSRNMHSLVDILKEKFGIVKKTDSMEETFEDSEFAVSSFDGSTSEIYLSNDHVKDVCKLIKSIRDIGPSLPTFEVRDCDFMDIDYSDEEQNI